MLKAHFEESQYDGECANGLKKLKRDAVPTIFNNHYAPVVFTSTQVKGKGVSTLDSVPVHQIRVRKSIHTNAKV